MNISEIKFLEGTCELTPLKGGYSGADKYTFIKNGKKYILKCGNVYIEEPIDKIYEEFNIPAPKVVDYIINGKDSYVIEEFVEGVPLRECLDEYSKPELYSIGLNFGKTFKALRDKFPDRELTVGSKEYLDSKVDDRVEKTAKLLDLMEANLTEENVKIIKFILDYLRNKREEAYNSFEVFTHPEFKTRNVMKTKQGLLVIDFESTGYIDIAHSLKHAVCVTDWKHAEQNLIVVKGFLDGLFEREMPERLLKALNYSFAHASISYILQYLKKESIERLDNFLKHIKEFYIENGTVVLDKRLKSLEF